MKTIYLSILLLVFSCNKNEVYDYKFIHNRSGIFVENFDTTITDDNKYTQNNTVYKSGNKYYFDYAIISKDDKPFKFDLLKYYQEWNFTSSNTNNDTTVTNFSFTVLTGLSRIKELVPDYDQTVMRYIINNDKGALLQTNETGLIDNEKNIWLHPPRAGYFRILEINPFPFIQAPYEIGNTWESALPVGHQWGDERWKTWFGNVLIESNYEITDISNKNTSFGEQLCYEVTATAASELGETKLVSWFNFEYGFMKLDYTNIDGSKTIIELKHFIDKN